jgi:hypothetical protein
VARGQVYWTQKGGDNAGVGTLRRTNMEMRAGETRRLAATSRSCSTGCPSRSTSIWISRTARFTGPNRGMRLAGNTVTRAPMDPPARHGTFRATDQQIVLRDLKEGIRDSRSTSRANRMYVTDLGGNVYSRSSTARTSGRSSRGREA